MSDTFRQISVRANGAPLPPAARDALLEAVIEDDLAQPAMFALRFADPDFALADGDLLAPGTSLLVAAEDALGRERAIAVGEVTGLEPELADGRAELVVRGYDLSHRLCRGRATRTFLDKTDSEIVAEIAAERGIPADVAPTAERHAYVLQENRSDMAFLRERALLAGCRVYVAGGRLQFHGDDAPPPDAPALAWGETLLTFSARLSAAGQPGSVEVRGWDPSAKRAVVGRAEGLASPHTAAFGATGGEAAARAFGGEAQVTVGDWPVRTQGAAASLAAALLRDAAGSYLTAEGECLGEPALRAGARVEIAGVGARFGGAYAVTATRHVYTALDGYRTFFAVAGQRPSGLLPLVSGGDGPRRLAGGVVVGIVTNTNDPQGLGRVRLLFPWMAEGHESDWARVAAPGAGAGRGLVAPPQVNDEVLVAFEHGDVSRPYVLGGLWNGRDTPGGAGPGLTSRAGHALALGGERGPAALRTGGGRSVTLDDEAGRVVVRSGRHTVTLDDVTGAVTVVSSGPLELRGEGGRLAIGPGGVALESTGTVSVQGAVVRLLGAVTQG